MKFLITIFLTLWFIGNNCIAQLIDSRDSHKYDTVTLNGITWMKENLVFETRKSIEIREDYKEKHNLKGRYYHFKELKNVCPKGWRIPSVDDWFNYFTHLVIESDEQIILEFNTIDKPYHNFILGYAEKINLFEYQNPLDLRPTGRIEGKSNHIPNDYADYWTYDPNAKIKYRTHAHIMNPWTTMHAHKHHLRNWRKNRLRKFMVRCVKE